jgi:hypothetical protein
MNQSPTSLSPSTAKSGPGPYDGYRSIYLIFRYQSLSPERAIYNGQRIEIQIRSKLQHLWATAVETAQLFTGQALKSKVKNASEDRLRFFALTSSAFASRERMPIVPETPNDAGEIVRELHQIMARTPIMQSLSDWNDTVHLAPVERFHPCPVCHCDCEFAHIHIFGFDGQFAPLLDCVSRIRGKI